MPEYCDIEYANGKLVCHLPITMPTSKVRILRGDQPVASKTIQLNQDDVIEWQISYFADEHQRLVELGKLLELAYRYNLTEREQLLQLLSEIQKRQEFFTERYSISIDVLPEEFSGFMVLKKAVPILQKNIENVLIWIELKHKQRAVGFQPMLYLRIPIENVYPSLVGRTARTREIVSWQVSIPILFDTVRAFSIASRKHCNDMIDVLKRVLR